MKKILSIIAIAALAFAIPAQAQNNSPVVNVASSYTLAGGTYGNAIDTVVNTATIIKYIKVGYAYNAGSIQAVVTKISGTMGGTVTPVASNDGVNFFDISKPSIAGTALRPTFSDTLTPTSASGAQTKAWTYPGFGVTELGTVQETHPPLLPYLYYGVKYTGTGTMSAAFKAYFVPRRQ